MHFNTDGSICIDFTAVNRMDSIDSGTFLLFFFYLVLHLLGGKKKKKKKEELYRASRFSYQLLFPVRFLLLLPRAVELSEIPDDETLARRIYPALTHLIPITLTYSSCVTRKTLPECCYLSMLRVESSFFGFSERKVLF